MTATLMMFFPILVIGLLIPWKVTVFLLCIPVLVDYGHARQWSVWRFGAVLFSAALAYPLALVLLFD